MPKKRSYSKIVLVALVISALAALPYLVPIEKMLQSFVGWVDGLGAGGIALFFLAYVVGTVLFLPGSLMTIGAGVAFGVLGGASLALIAALTGGVVAFLIARYLAMERVQKALKRHEKFRAIARAIESKSLRTVCLVRFSPAVPFNLSNYLFGLTKIDLKTYALGSLIGMIPGSLMYAYLGHVGRTGLEGSSDGRSPLEWGFLIAGLFVTVGLAIYVGRLARSEISKQKA